MSSFDKFLNESNFSKQKKYSGSLFQGFFNELDSSADFFLGEEKKSKTLRLEESESTFDQFWLSSSSEKKIKKQPKAFEFKGSDSTSEQFWNDSLTSKNDSTSNENEINEARIKSIDEKLTQKFIHLLKEEDFEFGYKTRSEQLILEQLQINALATRNWLNEVFINYYSDETVIIGILRIIGRFDPANIFPQGQTIALAALIHKNDEIKELGIRAFEHWCTIESLDILKTLDLKKEWLKEYVNDVIADFEEQLCHI